MANKQVSASMLIIDGVPVKHLVVENIGSVSDHLPHLLAISGGKIVLKNDYYGECTMTTVEECLEWGSYHSGAFSFIDMVYDANGKHFYPIILSSQWYAYNYPEYKDAINKYCDENGLTRPDDMKN